LAGGKRDTKERRGGKGSRSRRRTRERPTESNTPGKIEDIAACKSHTPPPRHLPVENKEGVQHTEPRERQAGQP